MPASTKLKDIVANHIARYREGSDQCPRTKNVIKFEYGLAYIAEWDKQMLAARAKLFKRGVK
jgi:hypothetical protein